MSHSYLSAGRPNDSFHQHSAFQFATKPPWQRHAQNHSRASRSTISWLVSIKDPTADKLTVPLTLPCGDIKNALLFLHLPVVILDVQISIGVFSSASEEPGFHFQFFALFYASCNSLGAKRRYSFFVCVFNFQQWWDDCVLFPVLAQRCWKCLNKLDSGC